MQNKYKTVNFIQDRTEKKLSGIQFTPLKFKPTSCKINISIR
jgi:hypothetical protein